MDRCLAGRLVLRSGSLPSHEPLPDSPCSAPIPIRDPKGAVYSKLEIALAFQEFQDLFSEPVTALQDAVDFIMLRNAVG